MNNLGKLIREHARAAATERSVSVPVEVTAFNLDGEPTVTVRPLQKRRIIERGGEVQNLEPLEVFEIPYSYPSSERFAIFVPPEVGMQGFLMSTDNEIGEVGAGEVEVVRTNDKAGGFFVPSGSLTGRPFTGNPDWMEIRSGDARFAIGDGQIHLQAGDDNLVLGAGSNVLGANGFDLVKALKEMADRIKALEAFHGGSTGPMLVDNIPAPIAPVRSEGGVR